MLHNTPLYLMSALLALFTSMPAGAATGYKLEHRVVVAEHDGDKVTAELYRPAGHALYPVLIAAHGGDWKYASSALYRHWGTYLARHGYALLALDYRLEHEGRNRYPAAVEDMRAALRLVREHSAEKGLDARRIGVIGDSAGAQVAALATLTDDAKDGTGVKVIIGIYGVYDLAAQWQDDHLHRPDDDIVGDYLGMGPAENPALYDEASPLKHVHAMADAPATLLVWGTRDDRVDAESQSGAFLRALRGSGFSAQSLVIPGAPHYWASDPILPGRTYPGYLAPRLLQFLHANLPQQ